MLCFLSRWHSFRFFIVQTRIGRLKIRIVRFRFALVHCILSALHLIRLPGHLLRARDRNWQRGNADVVFVAISMRHELNICRAFLERRRLNFECKSNVAFNGEDLCTH